MKGEGLNTHSTLVTASVIACNSEPASITPSEITDLGLDVAKLGLMGRR